jgi:RNA polymerase sigma-70 factor (sigma-E family)
MSVAQDRAADFEDFVVARGPALWRTAWLLTGDTHLAEDLVQTALSRAWPQFGRIERDGGSFEAYVRRALVNVHLTWRRRRWWRNEISSATMREPQSVVDDGDSQVLSRHDLLAALATLTAKQRTVVVLRYFEDLTESQIAESLGCSTGTVKTHHSRALAHLRASSALAMND